MSMWHIARFLLKYYWHGPYVYVLLKYAKYTKNFWPVFNHARSDKKIHHMSVEEATVCRVYHLT